MKSEPGLLDENGNYSRQEEKVTKIITQTNTFYINLFLFDQPHDEDDNESLSSKQDLPQVSKKMNFQITAICF